MAEHDHWPSEGIRIHSAKVVGLRRMLGVIDRYGHYPDGWTHTRANWPSAAPPPPNVGLPSTAALAAQIRDGMQVAEPLVGCAGSAGAIFRSRAIQRQTRAPIAHS